MAHFIYRLTTSTTKDTAWCVARGLALVCATVLNSVAVGQNHILVSDSKSRKLRFLSIGMT